jgi:hypothetical protein
MQNTVLWKRMKIEKQLFAQPHPNFGPFAKMISVLLKRMLDRLVAYFVSLYHLALRNA